MKKIGIITILKTNNYGAELQAYATQSALRKMGYDAEIIDYLFYKNPLHKQTQRSQPVFNFGLKKRLAEWVYPLITNLKSLGNRHKNDVRVKRFEQFHMENTKLSVVYKSMDELYDAKLDYDVYMVGSDQVWNPGIYSSLLPYMLTFAPKGKKRVSYASSFGVSQIDASQQWLYKKYLPEFSAIGVREKNAVEMVEDIAGCHATWVLDPTLLLNKEDWEEVASEVRYVTGPYVLLYELTPCPYIKKLAYAMRKEKGLTIVRICKRAAEEDKDESIVNVIDAGPAEFVRLFADADMVITNSFHGTAFSINFGKEFYTVTPLHKQNNSRQQSLLELFSIKERLILEGTEIRAITLKPIDYAIVNSTLDKERNKSINFLNSAINDK